MASDVQSLMTAKADDCAWLGCVERAVANSSNAVTEHLTWSAFHSDKQPQDSIDSAVTALLPLFRESSNSIAMIKHAMDVIKVAVNHLNHDQTPVMACDQPLHALAKICPQMYRECKLVVLLGTWIFYVRKWVGKAILESGLSMPGTAE